MARWKLATGHYLKCVGVEWEYNETDRNTGRPIRQRMPVPRFLDPKDPADWTNKWGNKDNENGEIVVCHEGKGQKGDIPFFGDPTPDMIPVDDEAMTISKGFEEQWKYKPDDPVAGGFSQSQVDSMQLKMAEMEAKSNVVPGLEALAKAVASIAEQNQVLIQSLTPQRRV